MGHLPLYVHARNRLITPTSLFGSAGLNVAQNTWVNTGVLTDYGTATGFTIRIKANPSSTQPTSPTLVSTRQFYASTYATFPWFLGMDSATTKFRAHVDSGNNFVADTTLNSTTTYDGSSWYDVIMSAAEGGTFKLFVNGVLEASAACGSIAYSGLSIAIGKSHEFDAGANQSGFVGELAHYELWDTAAKTNDSAWVESWAPPMFSDTDTPPTNLAHYIPFNEGTGLIVKDWVTEVNNDVLNVGGYSWDMTYAA